MIQVTDKYAINILPECYAVATFRGIAKKDGKGYKEGDRIYVSNWHYPTLEDALIKISTLIEKDVADGSCIEIQQLIDRIVRVHFEMREYIKEACRQYAYRDDN